jgi:hypothetical protein
LLIWAGPTPHRSRPRVMHSPRTLVAKKDLFAGSPRFLG